LIAAIAGHIGDWFFAGLRKRAPRRPGLNSLVGGAEFYFDAAGDNPVMMRALHTVLAGALHKPAVAAAVETLNRGSADAIEADMRAGIDSGEIHRGIDPRTEAVLVLAAMRGIIAQWLIDPADVDLAAVRPAFIASLRRRLRRQRRTDA